MNEIVPLCLIINGIINTLLIVFTILKIHSVHQREDKQEGMHASHSAELIEIGHGLKSISGTNKELAESLKSVKEDTQKIKILLDARN